MKFIADMHIHSKYSRATAKNLDFENLYYSAQIKGVGVVGTGDFTYPAWIEEIESKLEEAEPGMFRLKKEIAKKIDPTIPEICRNPVRFILQTEISNIYKRDGRVRKNHNLVYFPDIKSVKGFSARLDAIGNIRSDGRPILGLDARDLLKIMLDINDAGFFVPAHIWTPWFSMFGSKSGFDSMEECFGSLKDHIFAVETGLSSDPPMNWRVSDLDDIRLISNSDAHSPGYLGRNASVFDTDLSFSHIRKALAANDANGFLGTLDMYPHQGKYHYDGHRKCNVCLNPAATARIDGICPECGRQVTHGVLNRVQALATREEGYTPLNRQGYQSIIPLADILSEIFEVGPKTKKVGGYYQKAIEALGPELEILTERSIEEIDSARVPFLSEAIRKVRKGDIAIDPGFDGEFGKVKIFTRQEKELLAGENNCLFDLPRKKKRKTRKKKPEKGVPEGVIKPGRKEKKTGGKSPAVKPLTLLDGLNPAQKKAVESKAQTMIIQAGPGTGKTRTLTARIAHLISQETVNPEHILALTFTNKAAKELEQRISSFQPGGKAPVPAMTFHAFCLSLLKEMAGFDRTIADDAVRLSLVKEAMGGEAKKTAIKNMDRWISLCKLNLLSPMDDLTNFVPVEALPEVREIYEKYQGGCREQKKADFEDLIFMTVRMLRDDADIRRRVSGKYRYIFIDEYQDLNFGQYELTRLISRGHHLFVIGDPDQSIYGFRGSDNKYFKRFAQDFPECEKIVLTQNYRSTQNILDASFQMISSGDSEDRSKVFSGIDSSAKLAIKEVASGQAEAVAVGKIIETLLGGTSFYSMDTGKADPNTQKEYSFADFAVLYRTGRQCETFINSFEKEGIPYQTADREKWVDIDGIRQLISLCRIVSGSATFLDLEIIIDHFAQGMGKKGREFCHTVYRGAVARNQDLAGAFDAADSGRINRTGKDVNGIHKITAFLASLEKRCEAVKCEDNEILIKAICEHTGLSGIIGKEALMEQAYERLLAIAGTCKSLKSFLDGLALNRDVDTLALNAEKVSLMTLHAAKGLEFPVVFVTGCEQGLVPFARDGKTVDNLSEERRLFYVAMTRAMDNLYLTHAKKRRIYGTREKRQRSHFIDDIEKKLIKFTKSPARILKERNEKQLELF